MKHDKARDSERLTPSEALISFMEDYDLESRVFLNQFPRSERHVLSAEIRGCILQCYRLIISANKKYHRKTTLQHLDVEVDLLRRLISLSFRRRFIDAKKFGRWLELTDKLGRMVGGWIKHEAAPKAR